MQQVIEEHDYVPSSAARSLVTHRSYEVSILVPRKADEVLANAFWSLLLLGITEQCRREGYLGSMLMVAPNMGPEVTKRIQAAHNFDGYVLVSKEVGDLVLPLLSKRRLPTVIIGHHPAFPEVSRVDVDNRRGGEMAAEHLIALGHRELAVITGNRDSQETIDRLEGYAARLQAAGLALPAERIVSGDYSERSGYRAMQCLLEADRRPTAVFCLCDAMAVGALLALHQAGVPVPEACAVVGYDDLPQASYTIPPLTTVRQPIYDMGAAAARLLIRQVASRQVQAVEQLSPELVVRATSRR